MRGGTDGRMDERTNESPPVFYRTLSPSEPLPKSRRREGMGEGEREVGTEGEREGGSCCLQLFTTVHNFLSSGPKGDKVL